METPARPLLREGERLPATVALERQGFASEAYTLREHIARVRQTVLARAGDQPATMAHHPSPGEPGDHR